MSTSQLLPRKNLRFKGEGQMKDEKPDEKRFLFEQFAASKSLQFLAE